MTMTTATATATTPLATRAPRGDEPRRTKRNDSVWAWLWYGVSAGLLAVILGIGVVAIVVPRFTGSVPLTVLSASMEPSLPPGTMLVVRPLAPSQMSEIRTGDVISYQPNPNDPTLITHRVVGITSVSDGSYIFTTKGDANSGVDPPVRSLQVRAVLWYSIPGLGWVNDLLNAQGNRAWIIPTAAGVLFAYAGYTVVSAGVSGARTRAEAEQQEEQEQTDA